MSPAYDYVGHKPEHIVGLDPKNISEAEYDALPWELQQAVLNNRGSDGNPLYQERPSRAERKRVRDLMEPNEPETADEQAADAADDAVAAPDPAAQVIPDASAPQDAPAEPEPADTSGLPTPS